MVQTRVNPGNTMVAQAFAVHAITIFLFPCRANLGSHVDLLGAVKKSSVPFPSQTSGRRWKHSTSLDAPREVRRMNLKGNNEGGETARKAVPLSLRPLRSSFLRFHATRPRRGGGYFSSPPARAGNLFVLPLVGRTRLLYPIPPTVSSAKRDFLKFRAHLRRARPIPARICALAATS